MNPTIVPSEPLGSATVFTAIKQYGERLLYVYTGAEHGRVSRFHSRRDESHSPGTHVFAARLFL